MRFGARLWNVAGCRRITPSKSRTSLPTIAKRGVKGAAIHRVSKDGFMKKKKKDNGGENVFSKDPKIEDVVMWLAEMKMRPRIDDATKTVRIAGGDLPITPLMDQAFIDAKRKQKQPKPKPDYSKHGRAERRLLRNPYARALATPIRYDQTTHIYLPRYFFQEFDLTDHPETGTPWWVPRDIMPGQTAEEAAAEDAVIAEEEDGWEMEGHDDQVGSSTPLDPTNKDPTVPQAPAEAKEDSSASREATSDLSPPTAAPDEGAVFAPGKVPDKRYQPQHTSGRRAYVLARHDLLRSLGERRNGRDNPYAGKWGLINSLSGSKKQAVTRDDMHDFVLDMMRRRIVDRLHYYGRLSDETGTGGSSRSYLVRCADWEEVREHPHRDCALWFGGGDAPTADGGADASSATEPADGGVVGSFANLELQSAKRGGSLPVHDMTRLLGQECIDELRKSCFTLREGSIFVLQRSRTLDAQLLLWKLQGYIAKYDEIS